MLVHLWLPSEEDLMETTYFYYIYRQFYKVKKTHAVNINIDLLHSLKLNNPGDNYVYMVLEWFYTALDHNLLFLHG